MKKKKPVKIIIKVEIETLFDGNKQFSPPKMEQLTMTCANLQNSGARVLIVSSGAIALGASRLGLNNEPLNTTKKQATSAVGQAELIELYQEYFNKYDQIVAQILLTKDVIDNPVRNRNASNTLNRLTDRCIIPVINENDPVSTDDIILNDNYPLVLIVAKLTDAGIVAVNTPEANKFLLLHKESSLIHKVTTEGLLEIAENSETNKLRIKKDIKGFPEFSGYAGLN